MANSDDEYFGKSVCESGDDDNIFDMDFDMDDVPPPSRPDSSSPSRKENSRSTKMPLSRFPTLPSSRLPSSAPQPIKTPAPQLMKDESTSFLTAFFDSKAVSKKTPPSPLRNTRSTQPTKPVSRVPSKITSPAGGSLPPTREATTQLGTEPKTPDDNLLSFKLLFEVPPTPKEHVAPTTAPLSTLKRDQGYQSNLCDLGKTPSAQYPAPTTGSETFLLFPLSVSPKWARDEEEKKSSGLSIFPSKRASSNDNDSSSSSPDSFLSGISSNTPSDSPLQSVLSDSSSESSESYSSFSPNS